MNYVGDGRLEIKILVPFGSTGGGGDIDPPPPPPDPTLAGSDYYFQHNQLEASDGWQFAFDIPYEDPNTPLDQRDGEHSDWENEHGETKIPVVRVWIASGLNDGSVIEVYPDVNLNMAFRICTISFTSPQMGYATLT
jgi:hypothetical protein